MAALRVYVSAAEDDSNRVREYGSCPGALPRSPKCGGAGGDEYGKADVCASE